MPRKLPLAKTVRANPELTAQLQASGAELYEVLYGKLGSAPREPGQIADHVEYAFVLRCTEELTCPACQLVAGSTPGEPLAVCSRVRACAVLEHSPPPFLRVAPSRFSDDAAFERLRTLDSFFVEQID